MKPKRYLVFAGTPHDKRGGMNDFIGSVDELPEIWGLEFQEHEDDRWQPESRDLEWWNVLDTETGKQYFFDEYDMPAHMQEVREQVREAERAEARKRHAKYIRENVVQLVKDEDTGEIIEELSYPIYYPGRNVTITNGIMTNSGWVEIEAPDTLRH